MYKETLLHEFGCRARAPANESGGRPGTDLAYRLSWWPSPPSLSRVRPRRPCPRRALCSSPRRSP